MLLNLYDKRLIFWVASITRTYCDMLKVGLTTRKAKCRFFSSNFLTYSRYIALEYVAGGTLNNLVERCKIKSKLVPLPQTRLLNPWLSDFNFVVCSVP